MMLINNIKRNILMHISILNCSIFKVHSYAHCDTVVHTTAPGTLVN